MLQVKRIGHATLTTPDLMLPPASLIPRLANSIKVVLPSGQRLQRRWHHDLAVWRPSEVSWHVMAATTGTQQWGTLGDIRAFFSP